MSSLEPEKTIWEPNRYKATEYIINYDASGNAFLDKKTADYTGVNYDFAALSTGITAGTTAGTTIGATDTVAQTTEAFGDVKPAWWYDVHGKKEDREVGQTWIDKKDTTRKQTEPGLTGFGTPLFEAMEGRKPPLIDRARHKFADFTGQTGREWEDVDRYILEQDIKDARAKGDSDTASALEEELTQLNKLTPFKRGVSRVKKAIGTRIGKTKKGFMEKVYIPGVSAARAVGQMIRPGADLSFRGVAGLYQADIDNMKRYGSTGPTEGNPTGDTRKDDAGYNIVNFAGNYNAVGTNSRRSNMLKDATEGLTKNSQEWKDARNNARNDWKEEKKESDRYDREQRQQERDRSQEQKKEQQRRDTLTSSFAGEEGPGGDRNGGGKGIICTQMYQQTQLEDWKKTMQLWYVFQKKYLTIEHQEGYHFLFKPFVEGMKKSKILTAIGKHCAIARTKDIKHIMFGTSFSFTGRLVRLVSEPICYLTGKIKSWL